MVGVEVRVVVADVVVAVLDGDDVVILVVGVVVGGIVGVVDSIPDPTMDAVLAPTVLVSIASVDVEVVVIVGLAELDEDWGLVVTTVLVVGFVVVVVVSVSVVTTAPVVVISSHIRL